MKHAKPTKNNKRAAAIAVVIGSTGAIPLITAGGAHAATMDQWDQVAQCESGGRWHLESGDPEGAPGTGASAWGGGLQFQPASWDGAVQDLATEHGIDTSHFGQHASDSSKGQQILAAEQLLEEQGPSAWATVSNGCASLGASMFQGGSNPWGLSGAQVPANVIAGTDEGGSTTPPATTPPATTTGKKESAAADAAIAYAKTKIGDPYTQADPGRLGPDSFDCSGLVYASYVYGAGLDGNNFPTWTGDPLYFNSSVMPVVSTGAVTDDILPGDLILMWFNGTGQDDLTANHVTMYIGNGQQIEANGQGVHISDVAGRGGRVVMVVRPTPAVDDGTTTPPSTPPTTPPVTTPPATPPVKHRHHDLDCVDIGHQVAIKNGDDPNRLDADHDGIGCEDWPAEHAASRHSGRTHVVQPGDTLWDIAVQTYGDGTQYHKIFEASNLRSGDPHWIYPGEVINLPN